MAAFWPGLFAQYGERQVIPLDGIIGSDEYFQNYVKSGNEFKYASEQDTIFLAIYLDRDIETLISGENPNIKIWSMLGIQRLWENKASIVQIHSKRLINPTGVGWYLLEMEKK